MKNKLGSILFLFVTAYCALVTVDAQTRDYAKWVNPFIGTGGHGHTFPGATMPFGMVQLSPDTRIDNWDGSSGYHYSDDIIFGFSHTHLSGTGIPDYCDILFMPTLGDDVKAAAGEKDVNGYASKFSHANEKAEPGYYSVKLDDDNILAEMTATRRVGVHRYTFPKGTDGNLVIDLNWRDKLLDSGLKITGPNRIEGFRRSSAWAKDQVVYFAAEFSIPFETNALQVKDEKKVLALLSFKTADKAQLIVKVGISPVSIEGARKNLQLEVPAWDFDKVRADARAEWNKELARIDVAGGTDAQTTTFYTALYHTMVQPNIAQDVDGYYRGADGKPHRPTAPFRLPMAAAMGNIKPRMIDGSAFFSRHYTVFSLWDTFRAAHPVYTIIDQKRTVDFINTFIRQYEEGGRLPVWELAGNETDCMIGYHSVSVIADAMAKGIEGFDYEKAYAAAKHSAELDHFGLAAYKRRGYISMEDENESVSRTLEYAYDDWCIAQMARMLSDRRKAVPKGDPSAPIESYVDEKNVDYQKYLNRARHFENLFDSRTGFFRPKKNGGFVEPFAPNEVTFGFTEGNSWQYSFFVPHDVARLEQLMGGRERFIAKLDELFTTDQKLAGREQADLTGLIGQYAHGNEPSHHIAYLYNYAGQPWKTQNLVRRIMDEFYKPAPDGLIGNEDCGQMSAWYIMSASGFYPVAPGSPVYAFGTPLFSEMTYRLENGKTFTIRAKNVSSKNKYIRGVKLNGAPYKKSFLSHADLMKGGLLEFAMTETPVTTAFTEFPVSAGSERAVAVPVLDGMRVFNDKTTVSMHTTTKDALIFYTTDGSTPTRLSQRYTGPITLNSATTVKAFAYLSPDNDSPIVDAVFQKRPNDWTVQIISPYSTQYTGGGDDAIVDGIRGTVNFASGEWQGVQGKTYEAVIDLQRVTQINEVGASFLQVAGPWIWMPDRVEFETSVDGTTFAKVAEIKPGFPERDMTPTLREYLKKITPTNARYVRMRAYNFGKIPAWHPGARGDPWIFIDEVIIR